MFPQSYRDLPERELLGDLERRIINHSVSQITDIINGYKKPPEFLIRLLRSYEYGDLKNALAALAGKEPRVPAYTDLGRFRTVHFEAYPDLSRMLGGTEFAFLLAEPFTGRGEDIQTQTKLDQLYYGALWDSLFKLPKQERSGIELILAEEIALRNVSWALRLRTYYQMGEAEIRDKLVFLQYPKAPSRALRPATLADEALAVIDLPLDTYSAWQSWKRAGFLNPEQPGAPWHVDPRYFQNAAAEHLYTLALHHFHRHPFAIDIAACFIKLKQFEDDLLTGVAEGLSLGIPIKDVFTLLDVEP
jgi:vacuolar-type H+-ATPase subunit C/Vma6